jgi:hypothetical protein
MRNLRSQPGITEKQCQIRLHGAPPGEVTDALEQEGG